MFDIDIKSADWEIVPFLNQRNVKCLKNPHLKQTIMNHLLQTYQIRPTCTNKYFRLLDLQTDSSTLKKYKHLVYANTNQNINLIVLAKFNGVPLCLYIDKLKNEIYLINCQFSPSLYEGTIFEGELTETSHGYYFLISDFLVYKVQDLSTISLDHRLSLLKSIFSSDHYHSDSSLEPFKIMVKDFAEYSELESFVKKHIPTLPYKNKISGLIFRPAGNSNKNLIYNFNNVVKTVTSLPSAKPPTGFNSIKSKLTEIIAKEGNSQFSSRPQLIKVRAIDEFMHTEETKSTNFQIDSNKYNEVKFMLFETGNPDDYILKLEGNDGKLFQYDYALVNDMATSQYFQKVLLEIPQNEKKEGICVLCCFNKIFKKWKPTKILPNNRPNKLSELK